MSEAKTLKLNKYKLQKCVLDIKNNITLGLTIKDLILNSFKEIKANIKQLQDDIKEMNDGFIPVTNQNVSASVTNNLLKKNTLNTSNIREGITLKYRVYQIS